MLLAILIFYMNVLNMRKKSAGLLLYTYKRQRTGGMHSFIPRGSASGHNI